MFDYNKLKKLRKKYEEEWFFSKEYELDWEIIETFSYSYANIDSFYLEDELKEFRWISFIPKTWKLFSLGFHKFFNYWEDVSENFSWKKKLSPKELVEKHWINRIYDKADWSLITLDFEKVKELHSKIKNEKIDLVKEYKDISFSDLLEKTKKDTWYEWFILELNNWERVKIKLEDYIQKHYTKEYINNDKKLYTLAINDELDDIKSIYQNDRESLEKISSFENNVKKKYYELKNQVEKFVKEDKNLSIKEFAIKHKDIFSLLIKEFKFGEADYKTYLLTILTK